MQKEVYLKEVSEVWCIWLARREGEVRWRDGAAGDGGTQDGGRGIIGFSCDSGGSTRQVILVVHIFVFLWPKNLLRK